MAKIAMVGRDNLLAGFFFRYLSQTVSSYCTSAANETVKSENSSETEEFRVLDLKGKSGGRVAIRRERRLEVQKGLAVGERANRMPVDQDWAGVWPGPRSFHPASVPLPLRMGLNKLGAPPGKRANTELIKIPNFLHLTPPAVKAHVAALKRFTTPWPDRLDDSKFPIKFSTSDYCHSSPTIRDPLARIATLQIKLSVLEFDSRSKDKFLRLVGERYNESTDILSIVADRCPTKKQNMDYAMYLLAAVYNESWRVEDWEKEKSEADMEVYVYEGSRCQGNALAALGGTPPPEKTLQAHAEGVLGIFNRGEDESSLAAYKRATVELYFPA